MINDGTESHFNLCCLTQDYNVIKYPGFRPTSSEPVNINQLKVLGAGRSNLYIGKVQMRKISGEKFNLFCREK